MIAKCFEIRDNGTFIPVLAVKLESTNEGDRYLLSRAGYGRTSAEQASYVQLIEINGGNGKSNCDPYEWDRHGRTYRVAHDYIIRHFSNLNAGAVIDVEFILGETSTFKPSESETH